MRQALAICHGVVSCLLGSSMRHSARNQRLATVHLLLGVNRVARLMGKFAEEGDWDGVPRELGDGSLDSSDRY
jgi:hypothetical protein